MRDALGLVPSTAYIRGDTACLYPRMPKIAGLRRLGQEGQHTRSSLATVLVTFIDAASKISDNQLKEREAYFYSKFQGSCANQMDQQVKALAICPPT